MKMPGSASEAVGYAAAKLIAEGSISAEIAQVMHDAYDAVMAAARQTGMHDVSSEAIARKILSAVVEGERNAEKLAEKILADFQAR